jgi:hypothetical protein
LRGAVRFTVALPTLFCVHCHCSMCRRNHGAGYVTWFGVPPDRLAIQRGADCGSSLFCDNTTYPDRVDVALGAMDGPIDRAPQLHVYYDSRAGWVEVADELPRRGGKSGFEPLPDR